MSTRTAAESAPTQQQLLLPVHKSGRPEPPHFDYRRREPEATALYRIVHEHLEAFLQHARETYARPLPRYVERELRSYLKCGQLREGFTRVRCPRCRHEFLVGFSCKGRGLCPSCSTRRMTATAAHMATRVLPDVPVRQWVLSVPHEIRGLLAAKAVVLSSVLRIFLSVVTGWYEREAKRTGVVGPKTGAVAFPQRFGGSLNLHVHNHVVYLDGVFSKDADGKASFQASRAPAQTEIASIAAEVGRRVKKMLQRRGLIRDEPDDAEPESQSAIEACMQLGLSRGEFVRLDARDEDMPQGNDDSRFDHRKRSPWSAEVDGFSVHAGVRMQQGDAAGRERLVRYCARPTLSLERLSVLDDGRIAYRVKYPRRGGRTHLLMSPMQFMARISALIPPPRFPLVRYSGVLAPASKWRWSVVPRGKTIGCEHEKPRVGDAVRAAATPAIAPGDGLAPSTVTPVPVSPGQRKADAPTSPTAAGSLGGARTDVDVTPLQPRDKFRGRRSTSYIDWATLMKHSMGIDVLECPKCSATMKPIAVIKEPEVIEKILVHLRMPLRPELLDDGATVVYDVTGEPVLDARWRPAEDDGWASERGPPTQWDCVDAPSLGE